MLTCAGEEQQYRKSGDVTVSQASKCELGERVRLRMQWTRLSHDYGRELCWGQWHPAELDSGHGHVTTGPRGGAH